MDKQIFCVLAAIALIVLISLKKGKKKVSGPCPRMVEAQRRAAASASVPAGAAVGAMEYDHQDFLLADGLSADVAPSHKKFVQDTYKDALLLGSSKEILTDHIEDINPQWGLRRIDYSVAVGEGARQVPSEYASQMSAPRAPSFV